MWSARRVPGTALVTGLLGVVTLAACAGATPLPQTRSVITLTGERVQANPEAMVEVDAWLRPQLEDIERKGDRIRLLQEERPVYPWQTLEITGDTATLSVQQGQGDAETPFLLYAHFRLMAEEGELEPWLPEAVPEEGPVAEGIDLERLILRRIADVWLLGRSVFDTTPYGPLDELLYSNEAGFLEEFMLTSQPERFDAESAAYFAANPERREAFRSWFLQTFEREGPGFLEGPPSSVPEGSEGTAPREAFSPS